MIDTIYTRSIASQGNAYFFRLIALSLAGIVLLLAAFLNLSIKEVIATSGTVVPGATTKIVAEEDLWIKLARPLEGMQVRAGETIATARGTLNDDELRERIDGKREQMRLLEAQQTLAAAGADTGRAQALAAEIALLRREIAQLERQLQPQPLLAAHDGELLSVTADAANYTFVRKGQPIAEIFQPESLLLRARIQPYQAGQIQPDSAVFVEDRRSRLRVPGRIARTFYAAGQNGAETEVVVEILVEQLAQFKLGMELDVRIVTAERKLWAILGDVFVE
jgi:hypothetical protein